MNFQAAIFDMDGTVLDTIRDLRDAVNYAMDKTGHRHDFTDDDARMFFGSGVYVALSRALIAEKLGVSAADDGVLEKMLEVGFTTGPADYGIPEEEVERISEVYRPYYAENCDIHTKPYDGIGDLLIRLRSHGVKTAVVSNKPDEAVRTLSADKFPDQFDFVLGEQQGIRRKPEPDMTDRCLEVLGVARENAVYIGDTEIDLKTAENAGMPVIGVTWGFRGRRFLEEHGARMIAETAEEVEQMILG